MRKIVLFLTVALIGLAPGMSRAADASPAPTATAGFTDAQRAEIEDIIKEYVTNKHPEVLAAGLQNFQHKEQEEAEQKTNAEVEKQKDKVFNDPRSPVAGNPKGDVTIVEFYDFNCGYCKMSEDGVERILKEDKSVRFIYKDFPILGPFSVEAAKAALASVKQGKFQAFHDALMNKKDHLSSDLIYQTAKDVGVDVEKLKKDMTDKSVEDTISDNLKLGSLIGVRGTPMFIVNDKISPGALQYDQLKDMVAEARKEKK